MTYIVVSALFQLSACTESATGPENFHSSTFYKLHANYVLSSGVVVPLDINKIEQKKSNFGLHLSTITK